MMERQGWMTTAVRGLMGLLVLTAVTLGALAPVAHAQGTLRATQVVIEEGDDPPGEAERWWGAAGAVLCGIEARLIIRAPAIGMNPYVLAAGIGGCLLALLDVKTTT
jgi:hypothetical protein